MSPVVDRNIIWVGSPNFGYGRGVQGQNHAKALVWHITGSAPNVPPLDPLSGLDGWFQNPDAGSTQFGIQDKAIHQYVRLADAAWGNGLMRAPNLRNDIIKRWWDLGINPNIETWSVEVVAEAGPNNVQVGEHRVNQDTWASMGWLGANLATDSPIDEFVVFQWQGHYMIDSITRGRDPITIYRPDDVRRDVVTILHPPEPEEEVVKELVRHRGYVYAEVESRLFGGMSIFVHWYIRTQAEIDDMVRHGWPAAVANRAPRGTRLDF